VGYKPIKLLGGTCFPGVLNEPWQWWRLAVHWAVSTWA